MDGSRRSNTGKRLALALLGGAGVAVPLLAPVLAADPAPPGASVGPPTPLFTPSPPASSSAAATPAKHAAVGSPGKHPVTPVQKAPLDAKALIPPAAMPAKLGPAPEPRPALSLETDLQPLGSAPSPASPSPPADKPPSS